MHKQKIASNSQIAYCLATTVEGFTQEQASVPASPSSSVPRVLWRSAWFQVVRAPAELTHAIFCSDALSLWLALTIRIGWCPHWQRISCALQSPRYGLLYYLYFHFLEGRKEGRMTCVHKSFPIYLNLFCYPSAHAHPVSPSTHAIPIHVRCVLDSWQKKVHCNAMAVCTCLLSYCCHGNFFLLNKKQFGALRISQTRSWAPCSNWNTLRDHSMVFTGHGQCSC